MKIAINEGAMLIFSFVQMDFCVIYSFKSLVFS